MHLRSSNKMIVQSQLQYFYTISFTAQFILFTATIPSHIRLAHGAKALYVFGDSYLDSGNAIPSNDPMAWSEPYGKSWPGYPTGRYSNGRTGSDFIAEYLKVPIPTPYQQLRNASTNASEGVNFAVGGAGVTYAWAKPTIHTQVDELELLVKQGHVSKDHLVQSVAIVGMAINDYMTFHGKSETIPAFINEVVDGIAYNIWRINNLGIENIMVTNVAPMSCLPAMTYINNFTMCVKNNATLANETMQHNMLLAKAVQTLHESAKTIHIIILDQTRTFEHLMSNLASNHGFVNPTMPCCKGKDNKIGWRCGYVSDQREKFYDVCSEPEKSFWWDYWHPTEAGWKATIDLYWFQPGFIYFGRTLKEWVEGNKV